MSKNQSFAEKYKQTIEELNKEFCILNGLEYCGTKFDSIETGNNCVVIRYGIITTNMNNIPYEGMQSVVDTLP